jgi:hypothetical protein
LLIFARAEPASSSAASRLGRFVTPRSARRGAVPAPDRPVVPMSAHLIMRQCDARQRLAVPRSAWRRLQAAERRGCPCWSRMRLRVDFASLTVAPAAVFGRSSLSSGEIIAPVVADRAAHHLNGCCDETQGGDVGKDHIEAMAGGQVVPRGRRAGRVTGRSGLPAMPAG